jgi:hypothetical protein
VELIRRNIELDEHSHDRFAHGGGTRQVDLEIGQALTNHLTGDIRHEANAALPAGTVRIGVGC